MLNDGEKGLARLGDAGNVEHAVHFGEDSIGRVGRGLEELVGEQVQPVLLPVQVEIGVIHVGRAGGEGNREERRGHDGIPNVVVEVGTVSHVVLFDERQL